MLCPQCKSNDLKVIDSRPLEDDVVIRRRRVCNTCHHRFSTREAIERNLPRVIKNDQQRESFDRDKIRKGVMRALEKRTVNTDQVDKMIEDIIKELEGRGQSEVSSNDIGELVMEKLKALDTVAYVRFASVYRSFQTPEDFKKTLENL